LPEPVRRRRAAHDVVLLHPDLQLRLGHCRRIAERPISYAADADMPDSRALS
jgi:hypothetical protein